MADSASGQCRQQVLNRRNTPISEFQRGAELAVADLIRSKSNRLGSILKTQMNAWSL
jgi:hypothetical protein